MSRYRAVCQRIAKVDRADSVRLLAVSKRHNIEAIQAVHQAGQKAFGESYVQEGVEKITALSAAAIEWHFIGPIQSNKTKSIAAHFDWVQSVDRMKILQRLDRQRPSQMKPLNVLLQLKVGDEDSKSGASESDLLFMYEAAKEMANVVVRGLMCIPPPSDDFDTQSSFFLEAKRVFDRLHQVDVSFDVLSMGMSGDLEAAIANGSSMVRIGTDVFGARPR